MVYVTVVYLGSKDAIWPDVLLNNEEADEDNEEDVGINGIKDIKDKVRFFDDDGMSKNRRKGHNFTKYTYPWKNNKSKK